LVPEGDHLPKLLGLLGAEVVDFRRILREVEALPLTGAKRLRFKFYSRSSLRQTVAAKRARN